MLILPSYWLSIIPEVIFLNNDSIVRIVYLLRQLLIQWKVKIQKYVNDQSFNLQQLKVELLKLFLHK